MRALVLFGSFVLVLSFAVSPARAACQVARVDAYHAINDVTACALDEGGFGDGTQRFAHQYTAHVRHAREADPVLDSAHALLVDEGTWT